MPVMKRKTQNDATSMSMVLLTFSSKRSLQIVSERSNVFNDGKAINDSRTRVLKSAPLKSRSCSLVKMFESIGQKKISQKHRRDNFISHTIKKKYLILIHENIFLQTIIPLVVTKKLILLLLK